jgi:hypothetical protein
MKIKVVACGKMNTETAKVSVDGKERNAITKTT